MNPLLFNKHKDKSFIPSRCDYSIDTETSDCYVYNGCEWVKIMNQLRSFHDYQLIRIVETKIDYSLDITAKKYAILNCRNCGAPVEGHKCQYCGSISK